MANNTCHSTKLDTETIDAICNRVRELLESDSYSLHSHNHLVPSWEPGTLGPRHVVIGSTIVVSNLGYCAQECERTLNNIDINARQRF